MSCPSAVVAVAAFAKAKASGIAGGTNRASIFYAPFPLTFIDANAAALAGLSLAYSCLAVSKACVKRGRSIRLFMQLSS